ncbi:hypothetical protein [Streptomyces sp. NPDC086023]|uniref:hypothetical protein n=1 Tax=Streptomyces sp. NPDC086023 TaxID=3365746 RepID=UPI0037CEAE96
MTADRESWDAFWAEVNGAGTETIRGVEVAIPTDLPLVMVQRLDALSAEDSEEAFREMVGMLFGDGVLEAWTDAGMGLMELKTLIAWGTANAEGTRIGFREAYERVLQGEAESEGKAPNRQARRAAAKSAPRPRSATTGGRSKATSRGSTATGRKTSPS